MYFRAVIRFHVTVFFFEEQLRKKLYRAHYFRSSPGQVLVKKSLQKHHHYRLRNVAFPSSSLPRLLKAKSINQCKLYIAAARCPGDSSTRNRIQPTWIICTNLSWYFIAILPDALKKNTVIRTHRWRWLSDSGVGPQSPNTRT